MSDVEFITEECFNHGKCGNDVTSINCNEFSIWTGYSYTTFTPLCSQDCLDDYIEMNGYHYKRATPMNEI